MIDAILLGAVVAVGSKADFAAAVFESNLLKGRLAGIVTAQIAPARKGTFSAEADWTADGRHGHITQVFVKLAVRREDPADSWRGPRAKTIQRAIIDLDNPKQMAHAGRRVTQADVFRHTANGVRVWVGVNSAAPMDKSDFAYARKLADRAAALGEANVHGKKRAARSLISRGAAIDCFDRSLGLASLSKQRTAVSPDGEIRAPNGANAEVSSWVYGERFLMPRLEARMLVFETVGRAREFEDAWVKKTIPQGARETDVGPTGRSYTQFHEWDFVGRSGKAVLSMRYTFPNGNPGGSREGFERQAARTLALAR